MGIFLKKLGENLLVLDAMRWVSMLEGIQALRKCIRSVSYLVVGKFWIEVDIPPSLCKITWICAELAWNFLRFIFQLVDGFHPGCY